MKNLWVIPDIHGNSRTLQTLIEEQIKPSRSDKLFFLGDYIDRGPDARGVIEFIMDLQADEYDVFTLRGNHEDYLLRSLDNEANQKMLLGITYRNKLKKEWFKYGGKETLRSFGVSDVHEIPEKYINWMRGLDYYCELDSWILVHAGMNFVLDNPFEDRHSMLWIKEFKVMPEKIHNKKLIHGHVPISLEFIEVLRTSAKFDYIDLDNGVYMPEKDGFGNLVALELNSMEMVIQPNLDMR
jgi:serine/threonine protein phosphatase 1